MLLLHSSKLGQLGHFLAGDEKPDTISTFANWVKTCQTGSVSKSLILSVLLSIWVVFSRERHTQKKSSTTAEGATADNIGIISHCQANAHIINVIVSCAPQRYLIQGIRTNDE
jgi:hypothetical protein